MSPKNLPAMRADFDATRLLGIADRADEALKTLRDALLAPYPRKLPPKISSARLARLCKITVEKLNYLIKQERIPAGIAKGNGRSREYDLSTAQDIVRQIGPYARRPAGQDGVVLSVGNFKGGVGKTTIAAALAQAFAAHGRKVLLIDLDPQASTTTQMGYYSPEAELERDQTIMPVVFGDETSLDYAIQPTYWPNLDFIPSSPALFGADFYLPNKQAKDPNFKFWNILEDVLGPAREKYDVILIDTPPTLSYLAIASFMATDGLVVPIPPETLDYASSTQFFRQFAELIAQMSQHGVGKRFQFIKVVLSKVKETAAATAAVRSWLKSTYPELIASSEIPETDVVKNTSAAFSTVYDVTRYDGSQKTYQRALDAFDALVDELEDELRFRWTDGAPAPLPQEVTEHE